MRADDGTGDITILDLDDIEAGTMPTWVDDTGWPIPLVRSGAAGVFVAHDLGLYQRVGDGFVREPSLGDERRGVRSLAVGDEVFVLTYELGLAVLNRRIESGWEQIPLPEGAAPLNAQVGELATFGSSVFLVTRAAPFDEPAMLREWDGTEWLSTELPEVAALGPVVVRGDDAALVFEDLSVLRRDAPGSWSIERTCSGYLPPEAHNRSAWWPEDAIGPWISYGDLILAAREDPPSGAT